MQENSPSIQANKLSVIIFHTAKSNCLVQSLKNWAWKADILLEMVKIR